MRVFLALSFVLICLSVSPARAQNDAVTDDDVMKALHGGGAPTTAAPRHYDAPAGQQGADEGDGQSAAQPEDKATPDPETEATTPTPATTTSATPVPSSGGDSLRDLKSAQDAKDNDENAPSLQAIGEGAQTSCPSREVAATVKMPDTMQMVTPDGNNEKAKKCEDAFQKLPDACADDNPCATCEKAVKTYSDACMYVENKDDMRQMRSEGTAGGRNRNPVDKIPFRQNGSQ